MLFVPGWASQAAAPRKGIGEQSRPDYNKLGLITEVSLGSSTGDWIASLRSQ